MGKKLRQAVGKNTDIKPGFSPESSLCGQLPICRHNANCVSDNGISQNPACWARKVPGLPGKYFHRPTWIIQETPGNSPGPERKIYSCFSMKVFEKWTASLISQCQTMLCVEPTGRSTVCRVCTAPSNWLWASPKASKLTHSSIHLWPTLNTIKKRPSTVHFSWSNFFIPFKFKTPPEPSHIHILHFSASTLSICN